MNERPNKQRWYQFSLGSLFVLTTLVALWFGVGPRVRAYWAVQRLSNGDVQVDGNIFGLDVQIRGDAAEEVLNLGKAANPSLQSALDNPERFAAAHVLLTRINQNRYFVSASHWNGLEIDLYADGRVDFHSEQMPELKQIWKDHLAGEVRPPKANRDWEVMDVPP